jgi:predicted RNase H-like nuclease
LKFEIISSNDELLEKFPKLDRVFIDMPIGIPKGANFPRKCDLNAKSILKSRHSSIFFPPCREALYQPSYQSALKIHRKLVHKGFSIQAWNLTKKIRELDGFVQKNQIYLNRLLESHPELCFLGLNHNKILNKSKHTTIGRKKRLELLKRYSKSYEYNWKSIHNLFSSSKVTIDDYFDAWVLCIAASLDEKNIVQVPINIPHDTKGIPMRISVINLEKDT